MRGLVVAAVVVVALSACSSSSHHARAVSTTTTAPVPNVAVKATCAQNDQTDAITGALGSASAIGWAGASQGVVTCLGGVFYVGGELERVFGFGVYQGGPTTWVDADGYLPAEITMFPGGTITEFADQTSIGGHPYVVVYARVTAPNPQPTPGLTALTSATASPHDYAVVVDRYTKDVPWPSAAALRNAGTFDTHYSHMRAFWNTQLSKIAQINVPNPALVDAYKSGFIYTQIARSGTHLNTGVNNYASEYNHDVMGILVNLFTQGDFDDAHALLLEAGQVNTRPEQYEDGFWTYAWPWAVYLEKTRDVAFAKQNFAVIEAATHRIAQDRTGPGGIIGATDDIDTNGWWTVDDYEALTGLAAYRYVAQSVGNGAEVKWAGDEYNSLLAATNSALRATIAKYHLTYLPCSIVQPNTANRCKNADDANWAAPFLFGRWAWDASLFGATINGPGLQLIDSTYDYGFARLKGKLPADTFGGYPGAYYSSAYNAGYGSWGLASAHHRDQGVRGYEFMIANTQSGPYSWWESDGPPATSSPWVGSHPVGGQGSSPHAWGIANANKVLLDSIVAERSDGTLIVGRGIPNDWLTSGKTIAVTNYDRANVSITTIGNKITLTTDGVGAGTVVLFELPLFVNNIASATTGTVDAATGTVRLTATDRTVAVTLAH